MSADALRVAAMVFRRSTCGRLKLDDRVVRALLGWVQVDPLAPESGGVLIGRWILGSDDVVVDDLTRPTAQDRASRIRFYRSRSPHQEALNRAWRASGGTQTWLGEWHTHPEPSPQPSSIDLAGWRRALAQGRAAGDALFFVVVGTQEVCVWEGRRGGRGFCALENVCAREDDRGRPR